jgi:hypothetical protein
MNTTMTFLIITAVFFIGVVVVHSYHPSIAISLLVPRLRPGSRFRLGTKLFIVHRGPVLSSGQASVAPWKPGETENPRSDPSGRAGISSDGDINLVY